MAADKPDFSGYVTRYNVKCSDGRTIKAHAFKHQDGQTVPLVWQHGHAGVRNVLGHLELKHENDGVRAYGYFNETEDAQHAKKAVIHKDLRALSIYANQLQETGKNVTHGNIKEGSLVLAGANPGAYIEDVYVSHGDGQSTVLDGEAIIYFDDALTLEHANMDDGDEEDKVDGGDDEDTEDNNEKSVEDLLAGLSEEQKKALYDHVANSASHADTAELPEDATVQQILETLNEQQSNVVHALIGKALEHTSNDNQKDDPEVTSRNVFDQSRETGGNGPSGATLSHDDVKSIFATARKNGSLKDAVEEYALAHGIDDISTLFPYDQAVTDTPDFISRRMEWVQGVLSNTRKVPFSRIRSWTADLTLDEARAKGYVKAGVKKEEFFSVSRRITTPQTVYKKQKLDRDDMLDITEFNVVTWLQTEMRLMLDEELARAILVGDGRAVDDPDKISATNVRPILGDDGMYVSELYVDLTDASSSADEIVDAVVTGMRLYRGSGNTILYTTLPYMSKMLLAKDTLGRRLYPTKVELAAALGVTDVIPCEALEQTTNLIGIVVNLTDYTVGTDRGGEVSLFDFFDIDFNQFKYLMETRMSGAMTKYRAALVVKEFTGAGGMLANPASPTFVTSTGVATVPTVSHVSYVTVAADGTETGVSAGAQTAIASGSSVHYRAKAASTYSFPDNQSQDWVFTRS